MTFSAAKPKSLPVLMAKPKDVEIKARVTAEMRQRIEAIAETRGESVSVVVREALGEYLKPDGNSQQATVRTGKAASRKKEKRARFTDIQEVSLGVWGTIPAGWPDARRVSKPKRTVMVRKGEYPAEAFGLDVVGDSMNAATGKLGPVLPGETVVLVPFTNCEDAAGKIVAALIDGHTTLKRLVCPKDADCYLKPESTNPVFAGRMCPLDDLTIQGVVVGRL